MKMKFIIVFFLSIMSLCNAQTVYLYTPKGSQVYAFQRSEMTSSDILYYTAQYASLYPNAEILANASATYNCHSYAWNLTTGGTTKCWLNQYLDSPYNTMKNLHYYWEDGSYEQTTEANAVKIFYYDGDHSAVKSTTHAGKYESKWGAMPLMRHSPAYGPYTNMQNRKYYKINISISGPSTVCPTGTYSLNTGQSATWSVSSGFTITPTNGTSAIVTANTALVYGLPGTVTAVVNGVTITKSIQACARSIVGPSSICPSGTYTINTGQSATWSVSSGFSISTNNGTSTTVTATPVNGQSGTITAVVDGSTITYNIYSCPAIFGPDYVYSCGTTTYTLSTGQAMSWTTTPGFSIVSYNATSAAVTSNPAYNGTSGAIIAIMGSAGAITKPVIAVAVPCGTPAMVFPNPVSDILNIEFDQEAIAQAKSLEQTDFKSIKRDATYDIRLYDGYGILLRQAQTQGEKVEINVTNLSNGFYYLHIYDGISEKPEMIQIIVQH